MTGTILITGANRGIGLSFAKTYHSKGWEVLATARNPSNATALGFLSPDRIFELDVSSEQSIEKLKQRLGHMKLDILINNAGIFVRDAELLENVSASDILQELQINSVGPLLLTKALLPNLTHDNHKLCKVINITSRMGSISEISTAGSFGYRASKAALNCFTKSLAIYFQKHSKPIAVMALHPGFIQTDMTHGQGDMGPDDAVQRMIVQIDNLSLENSGKFIHRDGQELPY